MKRYFAVFIALYTVVLLYMMFYASGREPSNISYLQTKPFSTILQFVTGSNVNRLDFVINIFGNVFLFSPFGWLGLQVKMFNRLKPITLFFLLAITIIESLQYMTGRGVADIDDVFLNTFGMLLGFAIFKYATWKNVANICFHFDTLEVPKSLSPA